MSEVGIGKSLLQDLANGIDSDSDDSDDHWPKSDQHLQQVLRTFIDITPSSNTVTIINSCINASHQAETHWGDLYHQRVRANNNNSKDAGEDSYTGIITALLNSLIALLRVAVVQLWDGHGSKEQQKKVAKVLMALDISENLMDHGCAPDHLIMGQAQSGASQDLITGDRLRVATVDRKGKEFVEYEFTTASVNFSAANTKDGFISCVVESGLPLNQVLALIKKGREEDYQGGWQCEVLHLLAQVCILFFERFYP